MVIAPYLAETWPPASVVKDACGTVFGMALADANPPIPPTARVLEIGCAEFDWLVHARAAWPDMDLTGMDWRSREPIPGVSVLQGNLLTQQFAEGTFDWIVAVSTVEHVGLGHYLEPLGVGLYQADHADPDGDTAIMGLVYRWLKPGGWLYFDVPFDADGYRVEGTKHRIYDKAAITARLAQQPWVRAWSRTYTVKSPKDVFHLCAHFWTKP